MDNLNNYRLFLDKEEYIPLMIGGMGMDISTKEMAVEVARLGGIGHISDAMIEAVSDRNFDTDFTKKRFQKYKDFSSTENKSKLKFDINYLSEATRLLVSKTMEAKKGLGSVFINIMEKLTMNNPAETLKARLNSALDAGIDGISLSAGLHLKSFKLIMDNVRFRQAKLGIIVSSLRALQLFLKKNASLRRLPDFVVVEGPLAGGHLGFGIDSWHKFDLKTIVKEIIDYLKKEDLKIPVIPAGGIFTGSEATSFLKLGASAVQVATRFTITKESGLPDKVKQKYFEAEEKDIEVNLVSPTGYPMRMLKNSPCLTSSIKPNCESLGYLLNKEGECDYLKYFNSQIRDKTKNNSKKEKVCLCSHMRAFNTWTCGQTTHLLKNTTNKKADGNYQIVTTEQVFNDYLHSSDNQITLPEKE